VGARCLEAAVSGAHDNVLINLENIGDQLYRTETQTEIDHELNLAKEKCRQVLSLLQERKE
jgi:formiminotetrahydrofolate cyclodeaminase